MKLNTNSKVLEKFNSYPDFVRDRMQYLRELVIETAEEIETVKVLEETLKWGEPSFVTKYGSTLLMDWKEKTPNQYAMYFQCTSRLIDTFRVVFDQKFQFEGKKSNYFSIKSENSWTGIKAMYKSLFKLSQSKRPNDIGNLTIKNTRVANTIYKK